MRPAWVGVYQYTVLDTTGTRDLSELRSIQDWYLRYELSSVQGVAEVASVGGFVKQYQVVVDPNRLLAYNIPLQKVRTAIQRSNNDVGRASGRTGRDGIYGARLGLHPLCGGH